METIHPLSKLLLVLTVATLVACNRPAALPELSDPVPMTIQTGPTTEGPRLSASQDGQIVVSWMERLSVGGGALHFSELLDEHWSAPRTLINDPHMFVNWADTPSVVPLGGDTWFAHWLSKNGASTYAYEVQVSHSTDDGANWSTPIAPHDDGTPTEHGFVSISPGEHSTQLVWLDGRKTANEASSDIAASGMTLRGATVDESGAVANEQLIDDLVCDCCSTDMATTTNGRIAVYRNRTADEIRDIYFSLQVDGIWQKGVAISDDGWKIAGCPVNGPAVAVIDDFVAIAWFTAANDEPRVQLRLSTNGGRTFGDSIPISAGHVMGQVDVEILRDNTVAVSWLAKNSAGTGDIWLAIASSAGISDSAIVGTTAYRRAVPQMLLNGDALLLVWTDKDKDGNRLSNIQVPLT